MLYSILILLAQAQLGLGDLPIPLCCIEHQGRSQNCWGLETNEDNSRMERLLLRLRRSGYLPVSRDIVSPIRLSGGMNKSIPSDEIHQYRVGLSPLKLKLDTTPKMLMLNIRSVNL